MPTSSLLPPSQCRRHAAHNRRLPFGAFALVCSACRLQTARPQLAHGARQLVQTVCSPSVQTPSCAVQCSSRQEEHVRTCSAHAGAPSTRHWARPCSVQKSSAHTEQRYEHASQPQWSCLQTTSVAGGVPHCGHAKIQSPVPPAERCALNVAL